MQFLLFTHDIIVSLSCCNCGYLINQTTGLVFYLAFPDYAGTAAPVSPMIACVIQLRGSCDVTYQYRN
uniref:Uncharacterized protein n=1 Tax=Ciona intestinalis TaxID=7719 RepID=H2XTX6_CIOIN